MRVLFISPLFPEEPSRSVTGAFQRMRMWLEVLHSSGAEIDILFFHAGASDMPMYACSEIARRLFDAWGIRCSVNLCGRAQLMAQSALDTYVRPVFDLSRHLDFSPFMQIEQRNAVKACLDADPDIIFFHRLHAMVPALSRSFGQARVLLDLDDVEHKKFARGVSQPPRWRLKPLLYLQLPLLWLTERRAIRAVDRAFVCSDVDRNYLLNTMAVSNVEVIPNAVQPVRKATLTDAPNVLFIGTYGYAPNVVAADYLIREVWPRVQAVRPDARLLIAGPRPEAIPSFHEAPRGVRFLGFVDDVSEVYRQSRVMCCPIQSGGGTRIKILEAASFGVPVVSTPVGAEGLDLAPEQDILLREDAGSLANACVELLNDHVRACRIGMMARDRVSRLYGRETVASKMKSVLFGEAHGAPMPMRSATGSGRN